MSNYPNSQDNNITLPGVSGSSDEDIAINALRSATFAIEKELGIVPSGIYSDVRARLDILEARIGYGIPSGITNDGYIKSPLILWNVPSNVTLTISDGYGAPTESRINGSLYMRADGYANNDFYIRRDGYWVPIQTEEWVAGGDLSGNHLVQKVIGIRTKPLDVSLESVGATQDGYHLTWDNADGYWRAETGFIAGSDLAIDSPRFGRTGQKVIRFQNRTFAATAPVGTTATNGSAIRWNNVQTQWEPQASPMIFVGSVNANDGYTTRTNISSNKALQSPMVDTTSKVGMVNFGSRSTGSTAGTTDSYAAILSGDQNTASGQFSLVVGGSQHIVNALYASVLNGLQNTSSNQSATVINGSNHTASGLQSFIADGYSHIASGARSFVINGGNNTAAGDFSGILNGITNTVTAGATHASILAGSLNSIGATGIYSLILGGSGNQVLNSNSIVGSATNATIQSNYSAIVSGIGNTIAAASGFSFIGTGNSLSATGLYSTILNSTGAVANGLHTLILNGNTNSVTATYSTVVNGLNNIISGNPAYATVVDGYNHSITSSGGFIGDGYNNTVAGLWSSILNGNTNILNSRNSTILNGSQNTIDVTSVECTILTGTANLITGTTNALVSGNGNTLLNSNNSYILGAFNNIQSTSSKVIGSLNVIAAGGTLNRVFGNSNNLGPTSVMNNVFGQSNTLGPVNSTHDNTVVGSTNIVDGYGNSTVLGSTNIAQANYSLVEGQFGKSRLFGQHVHANSRFNASQIGNAQFSRLILQGTSNSGAAIPLLLQDTSPVSATFQDGYCYDMNVRVLVVNTSPISPNPVVPASFVFDVLAHQEAGVLVLDNVTQSLITSNTSDDPTGATRTVGWTVSITASTNQLLVTVDPELDATNYVRPTGTPSNRRAVATIEMREMTRL